VLAVLWCGAASAVFAQSSAYSGSGSNASGARASGGTGSNANGSGANGSSANGSGGSGATSAGDANSTGARKVRSKVAPDYPALARQVNVTGKVKISATISPEGKVISTRILGGSPLLTEAANTAVKQWRYEPSAKETTEIVEVDFSGK
jgi:TonB family protein